MQIAQTMGGYSLGGADLLRRAMGKKIRAEMEQQREIFEKGAHERGYSKAKATEVFDLMAKFADYGFNKSHAAAYALVSYQTAWMKANHPVAFLAACMNLAVSNTDKIAALRQEAQRMGIAVLPPDINRSDALFKVEVGEDGVQRIRYALAAVKKVGQAAMEALVQARGARPFKDVAEFATRIDPKNLNKMQIENLARAGAFDTLNPNRAQMFQGAETVLRRAQAVAEEAESGQIGMFGGILGKAGEPEDLRLPAIADWPDMDRLGFEAEAIGFHLTAHPLDSYGPVLKRLGAIPSSKLEERAQAGTTRARVAGCVVASKERTTRTGSRMAWIRLSDQGGSFEVTVFSEVLNGARDDLKAGNAVLMGVELKLEGDTLRITATDCRPLDQAAADAGAGMCIWLDRTEAVPHIRTLLAREAKGRGQVTLVPRIGSEQAVEITLPGRFLVGPRLAQALKVVPGVERVEEV
jgi:DNA polymerase-3 subunit alpha